MDFLDKPFEQWSGSEFAILAICIIGFGLICPTIYYGIKDLFYWVLSWFSND